MMLHHLIRRGCQQSLRVVAEGGKRWKADWQGAHDVGGKPELADAQVDIDRDINQAKSHWETQCHALLKVLEGRGLMNTHQLRRGIESLDDKRYQQLGYYDKWALSIYQHLLRSGLLSSQQLNRHLGHFPASDPLPRFHVGQRVLVKREDVLATRWRRPHLRVPGYVFGCEGEVIEFCGVFDDPEVASLSLDEFPLSSASSSSPSAAAHGAMPVQPLYRVRFRHRDVFEGLQSDHGDVIEVELTQNWLTHPGDPQHVFPPFSWKPSPTAGCVDDHHDHDHDHHHDHDHLHDHHHDHGHHHESRDIVEQKAVDAEGPPSPYEHLLRAMVRSLQEAGVIKPAELMGYVEKLETADLIPLQGAKLVVKAWKDAAFKQLLLSDGSKAAAELGVMSIAPTNPVLKCVENTDAVHNLVVCTLCSCYPVLLLGRSPSWYKSRAYRARAVRDPRRLLQEFGTDIGSRSIRVHDSTAELRYIVVPQQPPHTVDWPEDQLLRLVTRDSMVGVRLLE